jgi:NAD(P)H-dependent FMN reductase
MHILSISGSLRAGASNTILLEAASRMAPAGVVITPYQGMGDLPYFNPDLDAPDGRGLPAIVAGLRTLIGKADGLLLSSPEYAHGMPGSFKNLLDWLVGSPEFPGKAVALLNTSSMSVHAPAQIIEVLTTMNARVVSDACVTVPVRRFDTDEILADPALTGILSNALAMFINAINVASDRL